MILAADGMACKLRGGKGSVCSRKVRGLSSHNSSASVTGLRLLTHWQKSHKITKQGNKNTGSDKKGGKCHSCRFCDHSLLTVWRESQSDSRRNSRRKVDVHVMHFYGLVPHVRHVEGKGTSHECGSHSVSVHVWMCACLSRRLRLLMPVVGKEDRATASLAENSSLFAAP